GERGLIAREHKPGVTTAVAHCTRIKQQTQDASARNGTADESICPFPSRLDKSHVGNVTLGLQALQLQPNTVRPSTHQNGRPLRPPIVMMRQNLDPLLPEIEVNDPVPYEIAFAVGSDKRTPVPENPELHFSPFMSPYDARQNHQASTDDADHQTNH